MGFTVGVLALQGAFLEHVGLLRAAGRQLEMGRRSSLPLAGDGSATGTESQTGIDVIEVRNQDELRRCDALVIPGGESTTISLSAARSGLLEPLRDFVKVDRKPVWGTCAGLILLAEAANNTMKGGQELIGGLDVRVHRNHFGRQIDSFVADLNLPFLSAASVSSEPAVPFPAVFIRAPIVEAILPHIEGSQPATEELVVAPSKQPRDEAAGQAMRREVEIMGVLPGRRIRSKLKGSENGPPTDGEGDIVAVRQGNVFGTSFHPELTQDHRIHFWWLQQALEASRRR